MKHRLLFAQRRTRVENLVDPLALLGRTVVASSGGLLSEKLGWVRFFLLTSVVALPAIILFLWVGPGDDSGNKRLKPALESTHEMPEDSPPGEKI